MNGSLSNTSTVKIFAGSIDPIELMDTVTLAWHKLNNVFIYISLHNQSPLSLQ